MNAVIESKESLSGVAYGLPDPEYRAVPAASNSMLKIIAEAEFPATAKWNLDHPKQDTDALIFGRAFHCAWGEPDRFAAEYVTLPEDAPKRPTSAQIKSLTGKKPNPDTVALCAWWDAWEAKTAGKTTISVEDYDKIQRMAESANLHPEVDEFLQEQTHFEVSAFTQIGDCRVKSRADAMNSRMMDLKSIDGITTDRIEKNILEKRYFQQHPFYMDVFAAAGAPVDDFRFIFVDKNPPHLTRVVRLPKVAIDLGRREYERAIDILLDGTQLNYWPLPSGATEEIGLPFWVIRKMIGVEYE